MKRFHPLALIVLGLVLSSCAVLIPSAAVLAAVMAVSALLRAWLAGFAAKTWLRELWRLLPLFLAVLVVQTLFTHSGDLLFSAGWLKVHSGSLNNGLAFCLRLLILLYAAGMLLRLSYEDFDLAFGTLRLPEEIGFMVFYALHVIPLAGKEIRGSLEILRLRGVALKKLPLRSKLRIYQRISLSLLAGVLSNSAIQATALELRGFRSAGPRTKLPQRRWAWPDSLLLAGSLLFVIILIVLF